MHQTHDLEIDLSIIVHQKYIYFQIINFIFMNIIDFVKNYFKINMELELIGIYKSITKVDEFYGLSCSFKE